jgi:hypothetical protein
MSHPHAVIIDGPLEGLEGIHHGQIGAHALITTNLLARHVTMRIPAAHVQLIGEHGPNSIVSAAVTLNRKRIAALVGSRPCWPKVLCDRIKQAFARKS